MRGGGIGDGDKGRRGRWRVISSASLQQDLEQIRSKVAEMGELAEKAATILLSPLQASAVAGTGTKAISAARIWTKLDEASTDFTKETEAATYTTNAALKKKIVIFEIDPTKCLDIANGFDCIAVSTGASNAANITSALLVLYPGHKGTPVVSPLTD